MTISICDIGQTSGSRYWTNQTLISSQNRHDNGRYPAERYPLVGWYATLVSVTIMSRLYWCNWKLKLRARLLSVAATKNLQKHFQTALLYLKVIPNIVRRNTYWERLTKMWSNVVQMCTTHSTKLCPEDLLRTSAKEIRTSVFGPSIS